MTSREKNFGETYCLVRGIRVREEPFGLLFYDPRGPKLTFFHSGAWIKPEFFSDGWNLNKWIRRQFPKISPMNKLLAKEKLSKALLKLVDKRLIVETVANK